MTEQYSGIAFLPDYDENVEKEYKVIETSSDKATIEDTFHRLVNFQVHFSEHDVHACIHACTCNIPVWVIVCSLAMELHLECKEKVTHGLTTDGGWTICASQPFTITKHHCLVYSFG